MEDLISVIIPVYNSEEYIGRCLDSVLAQTYQTYEIVIINDGSTDRTGEILHKYAESHSCIKIYDIPHSGVSVGRNQGLQKAQGDYIAFVDADDEVMPEYLEVLFSLQKRHNAQISVCGITHVNSTESCIKNVSEEKPLYQQSVVMSGRNFLLKMEEPLRYEITAVCWNKLYRKSVFLDRKYPENRIYEDSALMHELLYPVETIVETERKLYIYHTETVGITRSRYDVSKLDEVAFVAKRMHYFAHKKERTLYVLARKQYCIALLRHYYLMRKYQKQHSEQIHVLKKDINHYLRGWGWKKRLPLKVIVVFGLGRYMPYFCGAIIEEWDNYLEKHHRQMLK